ncbi:hypothetical protein KSP40_PGU019295 [Platanthera guangdongensis]|uniref:Uncharacterized protein n=1 Tax=Platanthera guangdongensis TaxID=2320717 RepID=A0ABR2M1Y0_9ASPA
MHNQISLWTTPSSSTSPSISFDSYKFHFRDRFQRLLIRSSSQGPKAQPARRLIQFPIFLLVKSGCLLVCHILEHLAGGKTLLDPPTCGSCMIQSSKPLAFHGR